MKRRRKIKKRKKSWFNILQIIVVLFFLLFFVTGGVASGLAYVYARDLPALNVDKLNHEGPSVLYDVYGKPFAELKIENFLPVKFADVPKMVKESFLAAEDARFYQHRGVDFWAILRSVWANISHQKIVQGGSTITQQLVKNTFLTPERTLKRKIQEVILALQLEHHYSKEEIFLAYLNNAYFGEHARGVGAAAETYFKKNINDLTLAEAALLAGLPQAPSYYSPFRNPQAAIVRRNSVLDLMVKHEYITAQEREQAEQKPLKVHKNATSFSSSYPYPYFVDYVVQKVGDKYGEEYLYHGGLRVYTTLNQNMQKAVEKAVSKSVNFPFTTRDNRQNLQPQAAIVVLDPQDNAIRALVGGREHTTNLGYNRATMAYRQPGSAFKPIIAYAPAIEYLNMTPNSVINDTPVSYGDYHPKNYDGWHRGTVTLKDALAYSINVPAVKLLNQVGLTQAIAFASQMGFTDIKQTREGLSIALGGLHKGVTPLQMAAAYAAFANKGIYTAPTAIIRITRANGTILEETKPVSRRVMTPHTTQMMTEMLHAVVNYGTGTRARIFNQDVAGKTGTTDQGKDIWFCGYTPHLVGVVWMGWDIPRYMPGASGGKYGASIWRQVMLDSLGIKDRAEKPRRKIIPEAPQPLYNPAIPEKGSEPLPEPSTEPSPESLPGPLPEPLPEPMPPGPLEPNEIITPQPGGPKTTEKNLPEIQEKKEEIWEEGTPARLKVKSLSDKKFNMVYW
jgi:penicillin-binding protein 1A